jgi:uncharacterized protein YjbJ (UPF0337 family)
MKMTTTSTTSTTTPENWTDIRGKIKTKWSKFADADLDGFKGNMNSISEKVQKVYGLTKDKAEQEYNDFKKTIEKTPEEKPKA